MTMFIILLVLTVLGLFSKIAELPQTFNHNIEYQSWCYENTEGDSSHC